MKTDEAPDPQSQFFVQAGPTYRLEAMLGLQKRTKMWPVLKVLLLLLVTWVPIVFLSWIAGNAFRGNAGCEPCKTR